MEQIDALQRPLTMEEGGVVLMDLLWSDPTTNDGVEGVQPSPRGPGLVTFGPDRVKEFCKVRLRLLPARTPLRLAVWRALGSMWTGLGGQLNSAFNELPRMPLCITGKAQARAS